MMLVVSKMYVMTEVAVEGHVDAWIYASTRFSMGQGIGGVRGCGALLLQLGMPCCLIHSRYLKVRALTKLCNTHDDI